MSGVHSGLKASDAAGFQPHSSGPTPVHGRYITALFRNGETNHGEASQFFGWLHATPRDVALAAYDVVAFKVEERPVARADRCPPRTRKAYTKGPRWLAAQERRRLAPHPAPSQPGIGRPSADELNTTAENGG